MLPLRPILKLSKCLSKQIQLKSGLYFYRAREAETQKRNEEKKVSGKNVDKKLCVLSFDFIVELRKKWYSETRDRGDEPRNSIFHWHPFIFPNGTGWKGPTTIGGQKRPMQTDRKKREKRIRDTIIFNVPLSASFCPSPYTSMHFENAFTSNLPTSDKREDKITFPSFCLIYFRRQHVRTIVLNKFYEITTR